jgi:hypothetical protein
MNQGFSYFFCMMIEGSGSIPLTSGSLIRIREAQKHVDPVDPDPQHCYTAIKKARLKNRERVTNRRVIKEGQAKAQLQKERK